VRRVKKAVKQRQRRQRNAQSSRWCPAGSTGMPEVARDKYWRANQWFTCAEQSIHALCRTPWIGLDAECCVLERLCESLVVTMARGHRGNWLYRLFIRTAPFKCGPMQGSPSSGSCFRRCSVPAAGKSDSSYEFTMVAKGRTGAQQTHIKPGSRAPCIAKQGNAHLALSTRRWPRAPRPLSCTLPLLLDMRSNTPVTT